MINQNYSKESQIIQRGPDSMGRDLEELSLDLEDKVLVENVGKRIQAAEDFYSSDKINLYNRRKKNKEFLEGNQVPLKTFKNYQTPYVDNLIWEAEEMLKPIAQSRMPDLLVMPAKDTVLSKRLAEDLTKVINSDLRKRETRRVLGLAWKHLPVYFIGAIKAYWDPHDGENGNYRFRVVHPENLVLDHLCPTNNPEDMAFIAEKVEDTVQTLLVKFPKKSKEIKEKFGITGANDELRLATPVKYWEVWFKWWAKDGEERNASPETEGVANWKEVEAVIWKYDDLLLDKMKNPYWDWTGTPKITGTDGTPVPFEGLADALTGNIPSQVQKIFDNYFDNPQKPYIFLNYDQWGEYPYDYTSRIEQAIAIQENINKRGMQITEMNDQARGKHVFSTKSGLTKKDIERLDLDNPHQDLVVNGPINETHRFIEGTPAQPGLYQELQRDKDRLFAKMGTNSTTRGERQGEETAMGRQILREQDFGRIDDTVEDTINYAAEKMAMWAMQFIKLFYVAEHIVKMVGETGNITFQQINKDSVEDGMEVIVTASGVDKLQAKREAYERARMGFTDPLSFFVDTGVSDPKGRTEKLLMLKMNPLYYLQQFVKGDDAQFVQQAMAETQEQQPQQMAPEQQPGQEGIMLPGVNPMAPQPPAIAPNQPSPGMFEVPKETQPL